MMHLVWDIRVKHIESQKIWPLKISHILSFLNNGWKRMGILWWKALTRSVELKKWQADFLRSPGKTLFGQKVTSLAMRKFLFSKFLSDFNSNRALYIFKSNGPAQLWSLYQNYLIASPWGVTTALQRQLNM